MSKNINETPEWEQRAMESMRNYNAQLLAAFREGDLAKKIATLDGLVRQGNSWLDLLLPENAPKPNGTRCLMAAGNLDLTERRGN